jgi:HPt (histidine-containing phosphotransfer) domain-containing protein
MRGKSSLNDNQLPTRAELETSNRQLRASLKQCEELLADCKDKLIVAYGLTVPDNTAEA